MELATRTRLTPKEPIEHIICEVDFRVRGLVDVGHADNPDRELIESMPEQSFMNVKIAPDALRQMRKRAYRGQMQHEIAFDAIGTVGHSFLVRMYKLRPGSYYEPARRAFDDILSGMAPGLLHYITFTNIDTLHLFWDHAKVWQESNPVALRINCTYEGMLHTLQVRRVPESQMTEREYDRVEKARARQERDMARRAIQLDDELAGGPRRGRGAVAPYHNLAVDESVTMGSDQYTTIKSLRAVVYSYGKRQGRKYSVRVLDNGSACIFRVK